MIESSGSHPCLSRGITCGVLKTTATWLPFLETLITLVLVGQPRVPEEQPKLGTTTDLEAGANEIIVLSC